MTAKLYKIEVPDYGDEEINRMAVVYEAICGMPAHAQVRCVRWIKERIQSDRLSKKAGVRADIQWIKP